MLYTDGHTILSDAMAMAAGMSRCADVCCNFQGLSAMKEGQRRPI